MLDVQDNFEKAAHILRDAFGRFAPPVDPQAPVKQPCLFGGESFNSSPSAYHSRLVRRGFVELGRGAYSVVYTKPGLDRVIKVCYNENDSDDWPIYAMWAQNQRSPHAIKVYSIKRYPKFYVAVMEKVDKAPAKLVEDLDSYFRHSCHGSGIPTFRENSYRAAETAGRNRYIRRKYPGLPSYLRLLSMRGMYNDLHQGNWGVRKDGSVVIFDPITSVSKNHVRDRFSSINRFRSTAPRA